jgi:hypothetical protein
MNENRKLATRLFKKNQIVKKKNTLPSKYELQEIGATISNVDDDDDFDSDCYEDVNFDARLYANRK